MSGNTPSSNVKEAFSSAIKEKYLLLHLCNLSFSRIQPAFGLYIMHGFNAHLQRLSNCNSQIKWTRLKWIIPYISIVSESDFFFVLGLQDFQIFGLPSPTNWHGCKAVFTIIMFYQTYSTTIFLRSQETSNFNLSLKATLKLFFL